MKRKLSIILLIVVLMIPLWYASAESTTDSSDHTFVFPASLEVIEEDALSGTAAETVIFPEGLLQVGDQAFEGMPGLRDVYIPETTNYIADSAFSITADLTIHGVEDSYAEEWAEKHQIPFLIDDIWQVAFMYAASQTIQFNLVIRFFETIMLIIFIALYRRSKYFERSKRPQDRAELNPIDYCFP